MAEPTLDIAAIDERLRELKLERLRAERVAALQAEEPQKSTTHSYIARPFGTTLDLALEAGFPAAAQGAVVEASPAAMAAVGGVSSAIGNTLAQGRRILAGEQEGFSPGQLVQAAGTGAIPILGPTKNAERLLRPTLTKALDVGKNVLLQGAAGLAGEAAKTGIDKGELPTMGESILSTTLPAIMGGLAGLAGVRANSLERRINRMTDTAEIYDRAGVRATAGMLAPEELAGLEAQIIERNPRSVYATARDEASLSMNEAVNRLAPSPAEPAAVFKDLEKYVHQITPAEADLNKLDQAARDARQKAQDAFRALRERKTVEQEKVAREAVDAAFTESTRSVLKNARELATAAATNGDLGRNPAVVRDLMVEHVAQPARAAFKEKAAQLYSLVPTDTPGFDTTAIRGLAADLASSASEGLPSTLSSAVKDVTTLLPESNATLLDLRRLRDRLNERVDFAPFGDATSREVGKITSEITKQIEQQAVRVYGEEIGSRLLEANRFYSEYRQLFDRPGVKWLYSQDPADGTVKRVLAGLRESGMQSDEVRDVMDLVSKMEKVALGEGRPQNLSPEQIKQVQDSIGGMRKLVIDNLRQSIFHQAVRTENGVAKVDGGELLKWLQDIGRPGNGNSLEILGFGTKDKIDELSRLFADFPDAPKMTEAQWDSLMSSPAFVQARNGAELRPSFRDALAAAEADVKYTRAGMLRAAGADGRAQRVADEADAALREANLNATAARTRHNLIKDDPVYQALNNEKIAEGSYEKFAASLLSPKSTATTDDLRTVVAALEAGPPEARRALAQWRERYLADTFQTFRESTAGSEIPTSVNVSKLSLLLSPGNASDAKSALEKMRAFLTPEQSARVAEVADALVEYQRYAQLGKATKPRPASQDTWLVGVTRRAWDLIVNSLGRERPYERLARAVENPRAYLEEERQALRALREQSAYKAAAGQGVSRSVQAEIDENR